MAFTNTVSTQQEDDTVFEQLQEKKIPEDMHSDPKKVDLIKEDARKKTLRTLNALKIVSPIISSLMEHPGVDSNGQSLSDNFRKLIKDTSEVSAASCLKLGLDPNEEKNFWVRNVFEKLYAEILKEQWVKNKETDTDFLNKCTDEVLKNIDLITFGQEEFKSIDVDTQTRLALIKTTTPIINEAKNNFSLFRDVINDVEVIMSQILKKSLEATDKLSDEYASTRDKANILYVVLQNAGEIYKTAWRTESKRVQDIMNNYEPAKLQKSLEKYPNGLPIDKIQNDFDKYFDKMLAITNKLVPNKQGALEKRIKM